MAAELCNDCRGEVPIDWRYCPHCARPQRFPNVVLAQKQEERDELEGRYQEALADADSRGCRPQVDAFDQAIQGGSRAVMNCWIRKLLPIVTADRDLFATFHQLQELRFLREPNHGEPNWAVDRPNAETALLGSRKNIEEIQYAALTLDGRGLYNYGNCEILLRDGFVSHRASLFQENTGTFMRTCGYKPPLGFRSDWSERHKLCLAKLAVRVDTATQPAGFPGLLMRTDPNDPLQDDFVEIQVFGPMTFRTFEKITLHHNSGSGKRGGKRQRNRRGATEPKALRDYAKKAGVAFSEVRK